MFEPLRRGGRGFFHEFLCLDKLTFGDFYVIQAGRERGSISNH